MITDLIRKKLNEIKPSNYRQLVREHLIAHHGMIRSKSYIGQVYKGQRTNATIESAIGIVFQNEKKSSDQIQKELETTLGISSNAGE